MDKTRIYLSFPMKGHPVEEYTRKSRSVQKKLEEFGYEVLNPLDNGLPSDAPVYEHMKADYKMLLGCDAIFLCEGWEYSHGCMNELQVAADCRLAVLTSIMNSMQIEDAFEVTWCSDRIYDTDIEYRRVTTKDKEL